MRHFDEILAISAERKGGENAVLGDIDPPLSADALAQIPDDRWLAHMTRGVFQAGFSWQVIERMWPGFETAFKEFDPHKCAMMDDVWFDQLLADKTIVRNGAKIRTVQENAVFVTDTSKTHGSFGRMVGDWPGDDFVGLLDHLKKHGSRLGGTTAQYVLRYMGKDSFILSKDVVARLIAEGVVDKAPSSKSAMKAVQQAFNGWTEQSGQSLKAVSRVLATSIEAGGS